MDRRQKEKRERKRVDASQWAKEQDKGSGSSVVHLPDGTEPYKLEVGTHVVDFMPYVVGDQNLKADEGYEHFECTYFAHRIPSPNGRTDWYLCAWDCFKKSCEVCKWMKENGRTADPKLLKQLRVTTRHLWVINDKPGNMKPKLKVLDTNHFNRGTGFGEMFVDAINAVPKYAMFSDLKEGLKVQLTVKEQSWPGGKYNAVTRIDFLPRDYEYPDELLDKAPCLDSFLVEPDQKELHDLMNQSSNTSEDRDEDAPINRKRPSQRDEDEETEDNDKEESSTTSNSYKVDDFVYWKNDDGEKLECQIVKITGDKLKIEDDDGGLHTVDSDDVVPCEKPGDEDQDEEETPSRSQSKPSGGKKGKPEPEEEENEEEEETDDFDEEPRRPSRRGGK